MLLVEVSGLALLGAAPARAADLRVIATSLRPASLRLLRLRGATALRAVVTPAAAPAPARLPA
jgi:hypothetical protein